MTDLIGIYDHTTGEQIVREMTEQETIERAAFLAEYETSKLSEQTKANEQRALKISAYEKLGLTEAEIEALLPTPKPPKQSVT
jgi:hypothetical protein